MEHKITGDNLQFVHLQLSPGEKVWAEAGAMAYMSGNMVMRAKARGGIWKGIKRKLARETFFVTEFIAEGGSGVAAFGGNVPGKIMAIDLRDGKSWFLQKDAFLCAEEGVNMDIAFQRRLGGAFFGGEGFILEKVWGHGQVFVHAPGDIVEMELKPDQVIKVSTGNAVGWEDSVAYDIQTVGGIKTALFAGEGLFVTTLRGPGKVVLQSLTLPRLANALVPFLPSQTSGSGGFSFRVG